MRDEQIDYIISDTFVRLLNDERRKGKDVSELRTKYGVFRGICKFFIDEFDGVKDILLEAYEDDPDFKNAGLDEYGENLCDLECEEYQRNVINPQIDSLNRR